VEMLKRSAGWTTWADGYLRVRILLPSEFIPRLRPLCVATAVHAHSVAHDPPKASRSCGARPVGGNVLCGEVPPVTLKGYGGLGGLPIRPKTADSMRGCSTSMDTRSFHWRRACRSRMRTFGWKKTV